MQDQPDSPDETIARHSGSKFLIRSLTRAATRRSCGRRHGYFSQQGATNGPLSGLSARRRGATYLPLPARYGRPVGAITDASPFEMWKVEVCPGQDKGNAENDLAGPASFLAITMREEVLRETAYRRRLGKRTIAPRASSHSVKLGARRACHSVKPVTFAANAGSALWTACRR
jgi:hypothetical protein